MTTEDQRLSMMLTRLERSGRRVTAQRVAVCEALLAHGGHPTPMEIRDLVWKTNPAISQATVYNTITVLEELGLLHKLEIVDDEHAHYDVVVQPHVNIVCTRCGQIADVHTDMMEALLGLVASRSGYEVARSGIIVYGFCAACQRIQKG